VSASLEPKFLKKFEGVRYVRTPATLRLAGVLLSEWELSHGCIHFKGFRVSVVLLHLLTEGAKLFQVGSAALCCLVLHVKLDGKADEESQDANGNNGGEESVKDFGVHGVSPVSLGAAVPPSCIKYGTH
jgi:hypothetical protein